MAAQLLVEGLATRLSGEPAAPWVTARDVALFAKSPFALWCESHAPATERDPPSAFNEMLKQRGIAHEARVLAAAYPDAEEVDMPVNAQGLRATLAAMASGAASISGAVILHAPLGVKGRVDVLERRDDAPSVFGAWHYVVKEIKLAKNLRDDHRLQAALYHWALGDVQRFLPPVFYVVNRDKEESAFTFDEYALRAHVDAVRAIRQGTLLPEATFGGGAPPWEKYSDKLAIESRDVSLVDGVGPSMRGKLVAAGFGTLDTLANAPRETLLDIRGIADKTAAKLLRNAGALVTGRAIRIEPLALPKHRTEVYFDLEGTGESSDEDGLPTMDYLIGALVEGKYVSFIARTADEAGERAMWRDFLAWFETLDDPVLYHWHHYEATHLKKLGERHGIAPALHTRLFASLRDLHKDATRSFAFPTYGTSIKRVAPWMGFSWKQTSVNAMESIALYVQYAEGGDQAALDKVLLYNQDDCEATLVVKDWLVEHGSA